MSNKTLGKLLAATAMAATLVVFGGGAAAQATPHTFEVTYINEQPKPPTPSELCGEEGLHPNIPSSVGLHFEYREYARGHVVAVPDAGYDFKPGLITTWDVVMTYKKCVDPSFLIVKVPKPIFHDECGTANDSVADTKQLTYLVEGSIIRAVANPGFNIQQDQEVTFPNTLTNVPCVVNVPLTPVAPVVPSTVATQPADNGAPPVLEDAIVTTTPADVQVQASPTPTHKPTVKATVAAKPAKPAPKSPGVPLANVGVNAAVPAAATSTLADTGVSFLIPAALVLGGAMLIGGVMLYRRRRSR